MFNNPLKYSDPSGYEAVEEVVVTGHGCDEKCQRQGYAKQFMDAFTKLGMTTTASGEVNFKGKTFSATDPNLLSKLIAVQAGSGSKTNTNNVLGVLVMASMGGGGGAGDDGSDAAPQPTSPYIPEAHRAQMEKFQSLAVEARDQVDKNCSGFCKLPWIRGTKIHKACSDKVNAFNLMNPYFLSEVSYLGGLPSRYGAKGSIRADGIYGLSNSPIFAVELKTGFAQMTTREYNSYKQNLPPGVPVYGISVF